MTHPSPHELIALARAQAGLTLAQFAVAIGCSSKGRISEMENGKALPTVAQALAIEKLSAGRIDAADLNADVAAARQAIQRGAAQCWALTDAELAALPGSGFADADDRRVILCAVCERRADDPAVQGCTELDCPRVTAPGDLIAAGEPHEPAAPAKRKAA